MDIRLLFWIFWICQFYMFKPGYSSSITSAGYVDDGDMKDDIWVKVKSPSVVPPNAVIGGHDSDGAVIYVGRAWHLSFYLTANVIPSKQYAYVGWAGRIVAKTQYDVLTGSNYKWVPMKNGLVPQNAVIGGNSDTGEVLFVGRAPWKGSLIVGKIHPSHHCMYLPAGGSDPYVEEYEALTYYIPRDGPQPSSKYNSTWVSSDGGSVPQNSVIFEQKPRSYIGRAFHNGGLLPALVVPQNGTAYVCSTEGGVRKTTFEVLWNDIEYCWEFASRGYVPPCAVEVGRSVQGEPLYIGRTSYMGNMIMGKVQPSHGCMYIPVNHKQVSVKNYEVLAYENYKSVLVE